MDHDGEVGHKIYEGMKKIKEMFKKNPTVTGIVLVGGATAMFFVGRKIYRSTTVSKKKKAADKSLEEAKKKAMDLLDTNISTGKLNETQVKEAAEKLFEAMDGVGTDLTTIKKILIDDNPTTMDIINISTAFGNREYGTFGSPFWGNGEPLNLIGWLKKEISSITTLYDQLRVKFTTAGFDF